MIQLLALKLASVQLSTSSTVKKNVVITRDLRLKTQHTELLSTLPCLMTSACQKRLTILRHVIRKARGFSQIKDGGGITNTTKKTQPKEAKSVYLNLIRLNIPSTLMMTTRDASVILLEKALSIVEAIEN